MEGISLVGASGIKVYPITKQGFNRGINEVNYFNPKDVDARNSMVEMIKNVKPLAKGEIAVTVVDKEYQQQFDM